MVLVTSTTLATLTIPELGGRGAFDLLLIPVLAVSLVLGLQSGLATIAFCSGAMAFALPPAGLPWIAEPMNAHALAMHLGEGVAMACIGASMRSAMRLAVGGPIPARWRPAQPSALVERLTPRELEVLRRAAAGEGVDDLAADLCLSPNTVKTHLMHCYDKLGAHNRAEAVARAVHAGLLDAEDLDQAALLVLRAEVVAGNA